MPCKQKYTPDLVRRILEFSEGKNKTGKNFEYKEAATMYGTVRFQLNSDAQIGHGLERHLTISPEGLRTRTSVQGTPSRVPGIVAQDLDEASAFKKDDWESLVNVLVAVLNSDQGQLALGYLDMYTEQGKTRFALVIESKTIGCQYVPVRVFYQGGAGTKTERLDKVCVVIDSNIGGQFPIKIVTAFPCKSEPKLEVGLSDVMVKAITLKDTFTDPTAAYMTFVRARLARPRRLIEAQLLSGEMLRLGTEFNSGWMKPNPEIYAVNGTTAPKLLNWTTLEPLIADFCDKNKLKYMTRGSDNALLATTKA